MILKSLQFILFFVRQVFSSKCGHHFEKENGFIVHLIDEENIMSHVDLDCGIIFYPEAPTTIGQLNREW